MAEPVPKDAPARRERGWPEIASSAVLAVPVLFDLARGGAARLFSWTAADAFYYLQVARHWGRDGSISFDGSRSTNGFHPLWQAIEAIVVFVAEIFGWGDIAVLRLVLVIQVGMVAAAVWLLGRAIRTGRSGRLGWWWTAAPVGAYGLLLAPIWIAEGGLGPRGRNPLEGDMPLYGTLWSYINGMETPVVLLAFAALAIIVMRSPLRGNRSALALGGAAALLTLGRLDTGAIAVSVLAVLAIAAWRTGDRERLGTTLISVTSFALIVVAYLVWNRLYAGSALPVSGTMKSTFPRGSLASWRDLRSMLFEGNHALATLRTYREFPTVVPGLIAIGHLGLVARPLWRRTAPGSLEDATHRWSLLLAATAFGVLVISVYDFFYVPGYFWGHWYWPISTVYVTLAAVAAVDWVVRRRSNVSARTRPSAWWAAPRYQAIGVVVAVVASLGFFVGLARPDGYHPRFAAFALEEAPRVREHYAREDLRLLAIDDGIDAWALDVPSLSGTGLSLDAAGATALGRGQLLDLALERGFDRISSVQYLDATGFDTTTPSDDIAARLAPLLPGQDLSPYRFMVDYVSRPLPTSIVGSDGRFVIIRFGRSAPG